MTHDDAFLDDRNRLEPTPYREAVDAFVEMQTPTSHGWAPDESDCASGQSPSEELIHGFEEPHSDETLRCLADAEPESSALATYLVDVPTLLHVGRYSDDVDGSDAESRRAALDALEHRAQTVWPEPPALASLVVFETLQRTEVLHSRDLAEFEHLQAYASQCIEQLNQSDTLPRFGARHADEIERLRSLLLDRCPEAMGHDASPSSTYEDCDDIPLRPHRAAYRLRFSDMGEAYEIDIRYRGDRVTAELEGGDESYVVTTRVEPDTEYLRLGRVALHEHSEETLRFKGRELEYACEQCDLPPPDYQEPLAAAVLAFKLSSSVTWSFAEPHYPPPDVGCAIWVERAGDREMSYLDQLLELFGVDWSKAAGLARSMNFKSVETRDVFRARFRMFTAYVQGWRARLERHVGGGAWPV